MKASELRVGNWVNFDSGWSPEEPRQIEWHDIWHGIEKDKDAKHFVEWVALKPIPITNEWLLKFGFSKIESSVCDSFYIGHNPITHDWLFDITWLKNSIDYSYEGNPFYKNGYHELKYLHQLQNLYFALTQEELEINDINNTAG